MVGGLPSGAYRIRSPLPHELRLLVEHSLVLERGEHDEAIACDVDPLIPAAQVNGACVARECESGTGRRDGGGESIPVCHCLAPE
jgi:hypothetical protein